MVPYAGSGAGAQDGGDDRARALAAPAALFGDGGDGGGEVVAGRDEGGGAANLVVGGTSADMDAGGVVGLARRGRAAASTDRDGPTTGASGAA